MDRAQWGFDRLYGYYPRKRKDNSIEPLMVGHRGVMGHPTILENTLMAFDTAVGRQAGIEFDLRLTRDHRVVVHHDRTLRRVHGRHEAIEDLTYEELRSLVPAVPTLDEVLDRYGHSCSHYFLEAKVKDAAEVEKLLHQVYLALEDRGLIKQATLLSLESRVLDQARSLFPDLARTIVFLVDYRWAWNYVRQYEDTGLAGWYFTFPKAFQPFLLERGLPAGVGQIDYLSTHHHFCNQGFSYHFTNRIDRLRPQALVVMPQLTGPQLVVLGGDPPVPLKFEQPMR